MTDNPIEKIEALKIEKLIAKYDAASRTYEHALTAWENACNVLDSLEDVVHKASLQAASKREEYEEAEREFSPLKGVLDIVGESVSPEHPSWQLLEDHKKKRLQKDHQKNRVLLPPL